MKYYITQAGLDFVNEVSLEWMAKRAAAGYEARGVRPSSQSYGQGKEKKDAKSGLTGQDGAGQAMGRIRKKLGAVRGEENTKQAKEFQNQFRNRRIRSAEAHSGRPNRGTVKVSKKDKMTPAVMDSEKVARGPVARSSRKVITMTGGAKLPKASQRTKRLGAGGQDRPTTLRLPQATKQTRND